MTITVGPAPGLPPSIRQADDGTDGSSNGSIDFATLLAALQASQSPVGSDQMMTRPLSSASDVLSFMGKDLAFREGPDQAPPNIAEVFNESGILQRLAEIGMNDDRPEESVSDIRALQSELARLVRQFLTGDAVPNMGDMEQLMASEASDPIGASLGTSDEVSAGLGHRNAASQQDVAIIRSNIARFLAVLDAVRAERTGPTARSAPDAADVDARPVARLREKLMAMLSESGATAHQLSLQASEEGVRVLANGIHLSPEQRDRLRAAMARLIDAHGYRVKEIWLASDAPSHFPLIGEVR